VRSSWQTKLSHDEWPGVVCIFGKYRLIIAEGERGAHYRLQVPTGAADPDRAWEPVSKSSRSTLAELLRDFAGVPGLTLACQGLPDSPLEVLPEFWEMRRAEWSAMPGWQ
jgi:hypothetical protein